MGFPRSSGPEPSVSPRGQGRLFSLVVAFCLVLLMVQWASRPESWHWLIPPDETVTDTKVVPEFPGVAEDGRLMLHTQDEGRDLQKEGEAPRFDPQAPGMNSAANDQSKHPFHVPSAVAAAQLPDEWLSTVDDQQLGIKASESEAYYRVLAHVSRLDYQFAERSSRKNVLHVNLIRDPGIYRGQLITVQGTARRIVPIPANENDYQVKKTYEIWLTTPDSGNDLWRVVSTQVDSRLPQGEQVDVPVRLTGYFFKQYSYASQSGLHIAPLLLAADVVPYTVQKPAPSGTGLEPYLLAVAVFTCFMVMFAVSVYSHGDQLHREAMSRQFPLDTAESKATIEDLKNREVKKGMFD